MSVKDKIDHLEYMSTENKRALKAAVDHCISKYGYKKQYLENMLSYYEDTRSDSVDTQVLEMQYSSYKEMDMKVQALAREQVNNDDIAPF